MNQRGNHSGTTVFRPEDRESQETPSYTSKVHSQTCAGPSICLLTIYLHITGLSSVLIISHHSHLMRFYTNLKNMLHILNRRDMPTGRNLTISYIGNGFVTPLEVEIFETLERDGYIKKETFLSQLILKGFTLREIEEELERSCYASWTKYIPEKGIYVPLPLGMSIWADVKKRAKEQESIIGLNISRINQSIYRLTVLDSSFLSQPIKANLKRYNFKRAPIMRYTAKFSINDTLCFLRDVIHQLIPGNHVPYRQVRDLFQLAKRYSKIWVIGKVTIDIAVTDLLVDIMKVIKRVGKRPIDWRRGLPVNLRVIYKNISRPKDEVNGCLEYLLDKGLIRQISNNNFTITGMGFFIWKFFEKAVQGYSNFNCIIKRESEEKYELEVCDSPCLPEESKQVVMKYGLTVPGALIARELSFRELLDIFAEALPKLKIFKTYG